MDKLGKLPPKPVNLALQGGGAHGAFTWGVLDKLLEDGRLEIEGISGTSAGAMNAVVLADGLMKEGRGCAAGSSRVLVRGQLRGACKPNQALCVGCLVQQLEPRLLTQLRVLG